MTIRQYKQYESKQYNDCKKKRQFSISARVKNLNVRSILQQLEIDFKKAKLSVKFQ